MRLTKKNTTIGYIRVSTEAQDEENQKYTILDYAQQNKYQIDDFISLTMSSRKNIKDRKLVELLDTLKEGDRIITTELSRLGRSMYENIKIIPQFWDKGIKLDIISAPFLSSDNESRPIMLALLSYLSEQERNYISIRTKEALKRKKAMGMTLGRPKGQDTLKSRILYPYHNIIKCLHEKGVPPNAIKIIVNKDMGINVDYQNYWRYVNQCC